LRDQAAKPAWPSGRASPAYLIWGFVPLPSRRSARLGLGAWEILAHRTSVGGARPPGLRPAGRQGREALEVLRQPRCWLAGLSGVIAINWTVFIWAVNQGRVLETSLGYYINPLINMAAGALLFRERIDAIGKIAIGLAIVGVLIQAAGAGPSAMDLPGPGLSFCTYGVMRKRVAADAQTGLLVECLMLACRRRLPGSAAHRRGPLSQPSDAPRC
jgi:chloramphenicol-sensitive protein RarD